MLLRRTFNHIESSVYRALNFATISNALRIIGLYLPVMGDSMLTRSNLDAMGVYVWLRMLIK